MTGKLDRVGPEPESVDSGALDSLLRDAADISEPAQTSTLSFALLPGDVVDDRFVIERLARSGGMGAIYRATERQTGHPVAVKVIAVSTPGAASRFAREAAMLADLSHPAIVRYLAHGATPQGTLFLAMEWLEGEDLATRLTRAPLSANESLAVMRRACAGVAAAHARGVVHRDLKPSNLFLVDREPTALKVLDFGIARQHDSSHTATQSGALLGTVGYMSPQQAMGPRDVDARADVFALGCVLFECLTGRAAFVGHNAVAVLAKVLNETPPRVTALRPELGEPLAKLVESMLDKDPERRPPDAAAVARALERCFAAVSVDPQPRSAKPAPRGSSPKWLLLALLAVLALAFAATRAATRTVPAAERKVASVLEPAPRRSDPEPPIAPAIQAATLRSAALAPPKVSALSPKKVPAASLSASSSLPTAPSSDVPQPRAQTGGLIQHVPF